MIRSSTYNNFNRFNKLKSNLVKWLEVLQFEACEWKNINSAFYVAKISFYLSVYISHRFCCLSQLIYLVFRGDLLPQFPLFEICIF